MRQLAAIGLLALGLAGAPGGVRAASLCVEAESAFTNEPPMVRVDPANPAAGIKPVAGASGQMYLEVPLGAGKVPKVKGGSARIALEVPADGAYTLWLRTFWDGECSNTLQVQMDDQPPFLVGGDATFHAWHWIKFPVSKLASPLKLTRGRTR